MNGFTNIANADPTAFEKLLFDPKSPQLFRALQYLPSGKVMFTDNQTTLDMRSPSTNFGISSQLIISLDDIAFNSNQSECAALRSSEKGNVYFDILWLNTMLIAASLRTTDNRFLDGMSLTQFSLWSYGFMNTATGNQASHCMIVLGTLRAVNSNIVLIDTSCNEEQRKAIEKMGLPTGKDF